MKWWFEWGDIDDSHDFAFGETSPPGFWYGPYETFDEARRQLLMRFRSSRDELNSCIATVKAARASDYKERL